MTKVSQAQLNKAKLQLLDAIGTYLKDGTTKDQLLAMVAGMYDFTVTWNEQSRPEAETD